MKTVNVKPHQCLLDIAMQEKGSIAALFDFALANTRSITDDYLAGESLFIPDIDVIDMRMWQDLQSEGVIPANGFTPEEVVNVLGGIGYMGVQLDLRIS